MNLLDLRILVKYFLILNTLGFYGSVKALIDGEIVGANEMKYVVAIILDKWLACTGSIISEQHILTVAHCMYDVGTQRVSKGWFRVIADTRNWQMLPSSSKIVDVDKVYTPLIKGKRWKKGFKGDIAVLKLASPLDISDGLQVLQLPTANSNFLKHGYLIYAMKFHVGGFGCSQMQIIKGNCFKKLVINALSTYDLRKAFIRIRTPADCKNGFGALRPISKSHLCGYFVCSGQSRGQSSLGKGDSGAPLIPFGHNLVIGVANGLHPFPIGNTLGPQIFSNVLHYLDFLNNAISDTDENLFVELIRNEAANYV